MDHDLSLHSTPEREGQLWRNFFLRISVVIVLTGILISLGVLFSSTNLLDQSLYLRGKAHFKDIVLTRRWNSAYGGVYVEKKPGIESNPYLSNPDITSTEGKVYTKKNPALMTREISEIAEKEGDYQFHITSLKLKNPSNGPDAWEHQALIAFENGEKEMYTQETRDKATYYRYMAPLYVEESCLQCHNDQGYEVGQVRGGISVSFDITEINRVKTNNQALIAGLFILTLLLVLGGIFSFVRSLYSRLSAAQQIIREMAILDDLTKLFNRRYFFHILEKEVSRAQRYQNPLSCIMLDADHFKRINDTYGHGGGDLVLKALSACIKKNIRQSDIAARYGGEEFMILLPQTSLENARLAAEKIRLAIAALEIVDPNKRTIQLTASLGVAELQAEKGEQALEDLIQRVDQALYQAKAAGRNNVQG